MSTQHTTDKIFHLTNACTNYPREKNRRFEVAFIVTSAFDITDGDGNWLCKKEHK